MTRLVEAARERLAARRHRRLVGAGGRGARGRGARERGRRRLVGAVGAVGRVGVVGGAGRELADIAGDRAVEDRVELGLMSP